MLPLDQVTLLQLFVYLSTEYDGRICKDDKVMKLDVISSFEYLNGSVRLIAVSNQIVHLKQGDTHDILYIQ